MPLAAQPDALAVVDPGRDRDFDAPLFDDADFTLNADEDGGDLRLWTAGVGGPVAMEARASW